jgi:hypothetical protein
MEYMEKFKLPLKFYGSSNIFSDRRVFKKRGIECIA